MIRSVRRGPRTSRRRSGRTAAHMSLAVLALAGCRPGEESRTPRPAAAAIANLPAGAAPAVRVGIAVNADSIVVTGPGDLAAGAEARAYLARNERWVVRAAGDEIEATSPGKRPIRTRQALVVRSGADGLARIDDLAYHGEVLVRRGRSGGVTAVNVLDLEAYLQGVVPHEIGRRPPGDIEAVKAQAVAARTYAVGNMGAREAEGFDFHATVMDQLYRGAGDEDSVASRAVRETRGQIVTYDGQPILAYYSSTCGGQTAAIEQSWPWRAPLPYLKSVSDRVPGSDAYYCDTSSRFRWTTRWTRRQLLDVLGQTLRSATAPRRIDVAMVSTNDAGRATLRISVDQHDHVLRADSVRWVLRAAPGGAILNSSRIDAVEVDRENGELAALEIRGGGWGHGIGMCQVGALGRARAGQRYDQILRTYYTGTEIQTAY